MANRQRIRGSLSSPAATCRRNQRGCGGTGLSWLVPGHGCCPTDCPGQCSSCPSHSLAPRDGGKGCELCPCQLCPEDTAAPHTDGREQDQHSCSLPPRRSPSSQPLCRHSRSPVPQLCGSNVVLPGTCFFTSSFRSSESPEAAAMALLTWKAAGLVRGLPGTGDTGQAGLRWDCHMHWLWDHCTNVSVPP